MTISLEILVVSVALLVFGSLSLLSALRLRSGEMGVFYLTFYASLGFFLNLLLLMNLLQVTTLAGITNPLIQEALLLAFILTFGALTLNFLKKTQKSLIIYSSAALVILLLWNVLAFNWQGGGEATATSLARINVNLDQARPVTFIASGLGWVVAIVTTIIALAQEFRKRQPTQYLNRLRYWSIITALLSAGGLIFFIRSDIFNEAGLTLLIAGSALAGYLVLSYHTPDLKLLVGRALRYFGVTLVTSTITLLALGLFGIMIISQNISDRTGVLFWSAVLGISLAIIFPDLRRLIYQFLTRIIFGENRRDRDEKKVIKTYSQNISSALDLQRLGDTLISLMIETLGIEQGIVFVKDVETQGKLSLRPLSSVGVTGLTSGHFRIDSPFVDHFRQEKDILSQYDIDVLPEFRSTPPEERDWLSSLGMELYVPILRQQELVGLLTFGPQPKGTAYYEEDQDLMITLADQTALAIDGARLFEQLAIVNQEVGELNSRIANLDQDKSDFLSIASHELRTPLTHIHGYSRMLLDLTDEELKDPNYVKAMISGIVKGSERMKDVVDMMFYVTEVDVGEMNLFLGPVALTEVLGQALRSLQSALEQRRITFHQTGIETLPIVEADGTRLVQVFENLIGNAIKYTPDGGQVMVNGRSIDDEVLGPAIEIVVSDNGIGIDPEHHERIFEKFFRVGETMHHSTGKTKFKGAGPGLGLALVKGIIEAHGGWIAVESPGQDEANCPGSKFLFAIPTQESGPKPPSKQALIETRHWRRKDLQPVDEKTNES